MNTKVFKLNTIKMNTKVFKLNTIKNEYYI